MLGCLSCGDAFDLFGGKTVDRDEDVDDDGKRTDRLTPSRQGSYIDVFFRFPSSLRLSGGDPCLHHLDTDGLDGP